MAKVIKIAPKGVNNLRFSGIKFLKCAGFRMEPMVTPDLAVINHKLEREAKANSNNV